MSERFDAIVIGGGVVGAASAHHLAERGASVVLLERGEICSGASYGNAGWIFPSHGTPLPAPGVIGQALRWLFDPESPFYVKPRLDLELVRWLAGFLRAATATRARETLRLNRELSLANLALCAELASRPGVEIGFARRGLIVLCESEAGLAAAHHEDGVLRELGGDGRALSPADVRELAPRVAGAITGGVLFPVDAHVQPARLVAELARLAVARGARIRTGHEVLAIARDGRRITHVRTTRGDFEAGEVVIAGGAWSPQISRDLGLRLPVQGAKGYSITVRCPSDFGETPIMLSESKVFVTPMGEVLRFGGTLELAGLDLSVNLRRVRAVERAVARVLPGVETEPHVETWRGLRPLTPDDRPILGRTRKFDNLVIATGHGMSGISQGVISGRLVAEIVAGERTGLDLAPFSPDRFG
ncbi:MAG: FAD-dependent oxidoreductase [Deltaproteobacteria bacterium]|nr:FAD-dependent oxidoreductase [Deltaproteobacteria bacterium]